MKNNSLFTQKCKGTFYRRNIKEHLIQTYGIRLDANLIKNIMKKRLECSFKCCSLRPKSIDYKVLKLKKILFSIKIWKVINSQTILINVDESTVSNSTKANYSCGWKGIPRNLSTVNIRGSISLIIVIMSKTDKFFGD